MEHLKKFEGSFLEDLDKKSKEYQEKYKDKYVVLEYQEELYLAKFISIVLNGYFAKVEYYDWDSEFNGYNVHSVEPIHLSDFYVLESFDNMNNAKQAYIRLLDAKNYNL